MKYCHQCEKRYADELLQFCLDDGTSLSDKPRPRSMAGQPKQGPLADKPKQSTIDTVAFTHSITAEKIPQTEELIVDFDKHWDKTQPPKKPVVNKPAVKKPVFNLESAQRKAHKPQPGVAWHLVLPALVLVFAGIGVGAWFFFNSSQSGGTSQTASLDEPKNTSPANSVPSSVQTSLANTTSLAQNVSSTTSSNPDDLKKEVTDNLNAWKDSAEARNVAAYISKYADTVDYYGKNDVSLTEVRNEVQKTFSAYSDIDIILSNVRVAVDSDGHHATASFDKEWTYEADKHLTHGKDQLRLQLEKNGSEWKIFSEKVRKNYYTRS